MTQLADIPWLKTEDVTYWGDLDAEGFEILNRLRECLPRVRSLRMDEAAVIEFQHLATAGNPVLEKPLSQLTETEQRAYTRLCDQAIRIEQEHLPMWNSVAIGDETSSPGWPVSNAKPHWSGSFSP